MQIEIDMPCCDCCLRCLFAISLLSLPGFLLCARCIIVFYLEDSVPLDDNFTEDMIHFSNDAFPIWVCKGSRATCRVVADVHGKFAISLSFRLHTRLCFHISITYMLSKCRCRRRAPMTTYRERRTSHTPNGSQTCCIRKNVSLIFFFSAYMHISTMQHRSIFA